MASSKQYQYACPLILHLGQFWSQGRAGVLWEQVGFRQRAQTEVTASQDRGVRPQGYLHTVTDIQQPSAPQALLDLCDCWEIQESICSLLRQDHDCNAQPQRVHGYQRHFDLRQVRPSIFAVTKLKQPLRDHRPIATRAGVVQAQAFHSSIIPRTYGFYITHPKSY
jgi:hypothetical protein